MFVATNVRDAVVKVQQLLSIQFTGVIFQILDY